MVNTTEDWEQFRGKSIPANFTCPISLEVMVEPVTLSTGHSFDRVNIERWFEEGEIMCPMTLQTLLDPCYVPNYTLRAMILDWFKHDWIGVREGGGISEEYDVPVPIQITLLCRELRGRKNGMKIPAQAIRQVRNLAKSRDRDRAAITKKGAVSRLVDILVDADLDDEDMFTSALGALSVLPVDDKQKHRILARKKVLSQLHELLSKGDEGGLYAAEILAQLAEADDLRNLIGEFPGMLRRLLAILDDGRHANLSAAAIRVLLQLCYSPRIREVAIDLGAVAIVVESLLPSKRDVENSAAILERLACTSDGRKGMIEHPLAIPTLVRIMNTTSEWAAGHATAALHSLCKAKPDVGGFAAIQSGALPQLLLVVQSNASAVTKRKAVELLKLLRNLWQFYNFPRQYNASSMVGHLEQGVEQ